MVRDERDAMASGSRLSERLRSLREDVAGLKQQDLAQAFGGKLSMISNWETGQRIPPEARLQTYARLFATPRSFPDEGPPRLISDEDLTDEEQQRLRQLHRELRGLREEALASGDGTAMQPHPEPGVLRFTDRAPIYVVCADIPEKERPKYGLKTELNYVRASAFADLDALLDLFGHLRAENPRQIVRIRAAEELIKEEMGGHLILLGGSVWNRVTRWLSEQVNLPLRPKAEGEGEEFLVVEEGGESREFRIKREGNALIEDVGVFARAPNPQAPQHTLTICYGITTRGVRGVVQSFSDWNLRDRNERYLARRFAGHASYGVVVSVEVLPTSGEPLTPDFSKPGTVLFEWTNGEPGPGQGSDR
jgi:transcriptional regulator with XRE-family HTH domain